MEIINNYCEMLNLNQAVKYKAYDLQFNIKIKKPETYLASIYCACLCCNSTKSIKQIMALDKSINQKLLNKIIKIINKNNKIPTFNVEDLIPQMCFNLNLPVFKEQEAINNCKKIQNKLPSTKAIIAILLTYEELTDDIYENASLVSGISSITLKKYMYS